jgi:two-component system phosphate regulon sensor histidine kinase PhoR
MVAAILLIVAFQWYWLSRLYKDEWEGLQKETNGVFRDVVYNMQVERFKSDTLIFNKTIRGNNLFVFDAVNMIRNKTAGFRKDSSGKKPGISSVVIVHSENRKNDSPAIKLKHDSLPPKYAITLSRQTRQGVSSMPDTAMLQRIARAGVNLIVQYKGSANDSATALHKIAADPLNINPEQIKNITLHKDFYQKKPFSPRGDIASEQAFIQMIANGKVLDDTLPVAKLDTAYRKELTKAGISVGFTLKMGRDDSAHRKDTASGASFRTDLTKVGLVNPYWYRAEFENPAGYLLKKISHQILFSVFLIAFTSIAFIFLYRTLAAQRRLTEIKNDFISNITHELKTPIATVNVAIEALRNFGGLESPERTKEYLDISASELQRLALLVDKVLKFSSFENAKITLQKESFDLAELVKNIVDSMKLQFEQKQAITSIEVKGDNFMIDADKLHIASVVYNLLDNALKYSKEDPVISVVLIRHEEYFELRISDNGVGIPQEYRNKIFDQFFRVPNGDRHNIKGYGLGLSYVNNIVKQHIGFIEVESELGKGSTFIVKLAFAESDVVHFDKGRKIFRIQIHLGKNEH